MVFRSSHQDSESSKGSGYRRFFAMIGTLAVVMYGQKYLNTYALDHLFFSQTRMWMALDMGGKMAIIMLAFMLGMYSNRKANIAIFASAIIGPQRGNIEEMKRYIADIEANGDPSCPSTPAT